VNHADDEQLAAFLDGVMDDAEARAFEIRLASDPELAARAERWRVNDQRIAAALVPLAAEPLDPRVLLQMGLDKPTTQAAEPERVPANDNSPWWRRHAMPLGGALAASLLVAVLVPRWGQQPQHDLSYALETAPSLKMVELADGSKITPTLTVRAADGRYCREFVAGAEVGLACRENGRWQIKAQGMGAGPADSATIATASGADAAALEGAYSKLGASDPLDAKDEAALISGGWKD